MFCYNRKCTAGYKLSKSQEKMYMDDIKLFAKNGKELETLTQTVRIYSQDIGMEDQPEYWEESWRLEETCLHSNSSEKSSANAGAKNSPKRINNLQIGLELVLFL